jgi:hypothetical protein
MSSRNNLTAFVLVWPAVLAACTNGSPSTVRAADDRYFIGNRSVLVDAKYRDRYACADGRTMLCECGARLGTCECAC